MKQSIKQLHQKSEKELFSELEKTKNMLFQTRFEVQDEKKKNTNKKASMKKKIAQILTVINYKKLVQKQAK